MVAQIQFFFMAKKNDFVCLFGKLFTLLNGHLGPQLVNFQGTLHCCDIHAVLDAANLNISKKNSTG